MLIAADHPLAGRGQVTPEELAAETMIARRSCEFLDATSRFFTQHRVRPRFALRSDSDDRCIRMVAAGIGITTAPLRSEEHTSELQSLMRTSYAVFCLKTKNIERYT